MESLSEIDSFEKYIEALKKCKERYLICMAVKSTLSGMNDNQQNALKSLGAKKFRVGFNGYVFVLDQGKIVVDKRSITNAAVLDFFKLPDIEVQMVSRSWRAGNNAMIILNGHDFSMGTRGLNIVVFDKNTRMVVDTVNFDFKLGVEKNCHRKKDAWKGPVLENTLRVSDETFDINILLGDIIEKYHLDAEYPQFTQMRKSMKAISRLSEGWGPSENIACIVAGYNTDKRKLDAVQFLNNLSPARRNQVDFVYCKLGRLGEEGTYWTYDWNVSDFSSLKQRAWGAYQHVYLISNQGSNFVGFWLRKNNVKYIGLYDYLVACNAWTYDLGLEYYEFLIDKRDNKFFNKNIRSSCIEWALYEEKEKYKMYEDEKLTFIAAKKCFFLSLVLKDFVQAKKWYECISKIDLTCEKYKNAWEDIEYLLARIKAAIDTRKHRDLIAVWVDTVTMDYVKDKMPFVSSLQDKSIWFENMISMTAFTDETKRSMFAGKRLIDDKSDNIETLNLANSNVMKMLYEMGYRLCIFQSVTNKRFDVPFISNECLLPTDQGWERYWEAARQMLLSREPCFFLIPIMGTHPPYYTNMLEDENVINKTLRRDAGFKDVDSHLEFYLNLVGGNTTSFVFSDHGDGDFWPRNHVLFFIYGKYIRPKKIEGLCCNIDFFNIISQIINHGDILEEKMIRDYVEINGVPMRRSRFATNDTPLLEFAAPKYYRPFRGYKGIVTKDYVYIHFAGGREWLSRRDKMQPKPSWYARPDDICDVNLLPEMRKKAGIDYGHEPPEYGMRSDAYLSVQHACEENYPHNNKKLKLLNKMISQMLNSSVALYLGNGISQETYRALSLDNRKKIACVINITPKCVCTSLNLPIVSLEKIKEQGVRNILVSTRTIPNELREFLINHGEGIQVFGLYGWFEVNGYHTKHNFYDFAIQSMDEPLPSPLAIPDFLHYASPSDFCEVAVAIIVQDEKTLLSRLHDILKQTVLGIRIYCLDLTGKAADVVKEYQKIDSCIEVISVDGYFSLPSKLNELISSVNSKYLFFLVADEYLHAKGLSYLHEIAEQTEADVVAAGSVLRTTKKGKPGLADFAEGTFELKREARILATTFKERSAELNETEIPDFAGNKMYRVDFLRKYGIRFQDIKSGWKDIFCLQTIFGAQKYVKAVSPVSISSGNATGVVLEDNSAEYARKLVESMFAYQQAIEAMLKQWHGFGNNPSLCDSFRERAMKIFDQQYFSVIALDDEMRKSISQTVQEELQKNPSIGMWWIKYLFMRSSFPATNP